MSEPIRHHYIPQFLLRNFSYDAGKRFVYYYDKKKKSLEEKQIRDVFMVKNLYRDERSFPDLPTKTEGALAKYESEVAPILQEKILAAGCRAAEPPERPAAPSHLQPNLGLPTRRFRCHAVTNASRMRKQPDQYLRKRINRGSAVCRR